MSIRSRTLLAIASLAVSSSLASAADETSSTDLIKRIEELDQQVKILARKAEIADEAAIEKAKTAVSAKADENGFSIGNSDKNNPFSAKLGVLLQVDGRFWINDGDSRQTGVEQANTFLVRRAQPTLDFQLGKYSRARVQASFSGTSGNFDLLETWVEFKPTEKLAVTAGRFKTIGIEYRNSSGGLTFPERGLPSGLVPSYEVGVAVGGKVGDYGIWLAGVSNGSPDGTTRLSDNDDDKDSFVLLSATPFKAGGSDLLKGLAVHLGASYGYETGVGGAAATNSLTAQYRSVSQASIFAYNIAAFASGERLRLAPAIEWYSGPIGVLAEYVRSTQNITRGTHRADIGITAWQIVASYVLTGEDKAAGGVKPKQAFNPEAGTWGAFEVAARVGELNIDNEVFNNAGGNAFAVANTQVSKATSASLGVNWWLNKNLKWQLSGDYTRFEGGAGTSVNAVRDRESEKVVVSRFQVNF